jgi:uncharacterized protein YdeI (YjbR/CyaY-like superfamily)
MRPQTLKTLDVRSCATWRKWLAQHHDSESEVWLVFHKRHTGQPSILYEDAVNEALCFGWIDSLIRRLDDARYARKFTPRKADSRWSTRNRRRYAQLKASGRLMPAGSHRAPTDRSRDAPERSPSKIPQYILKGLRRRPSAWSQFARLAPSYRRTYIGWIDGAKQNTTKMRRLQEAIRRLAAGKTLGLK